MNNINSFSIKRMLMLVGKIVMEQPRVFMMRALALVGVLTIGTVFISHINANRYYCENQINIDLGYFCMMFFVLGLVYTSFAFNDAKNKAGRISTLMLPALQSEKFIARFIVYVPAYIILFGVAIFIADAARVLSFTVIHHGLFDYVRLIKLDDLYCNDVSIAIAIFLAAQSFFLLGAIMWPSNSFIKTFASITAICVFYCIISSMLHYFLLNNVRICYVPIIDDYEHNPSHIIWCISILICAINYILSYLRYKETEVIQRLI